MYKTRSLFVSIVSMLADLCIFHLSFVSVIAGPVLKNLPLALSYSSYDLSGLLPVFVVMLFTGIRLIS